MVSLLILVACLGQQNPVAEPITATPPAATQAPAPAVPAGTPATGAVPSALADHALPHNLNLTAVTTLSVDAWVSDPLMPTPALELWIALDAKASGTGLQPIIVPNDWPLVLERWDEPDPAVEKAAIEAARAVDADKAYGAFELSRRIAAEEMNKKYPQYASDFYVDEKKALDAMNDLHFPRRVNIEPFSFITFNDSMRAMYQGMIDDAVARGDDNYIEIAKRSMSELDDHVRVLLIAETEPHLVPVHLAIGGWNENPDRVTHAGLFKHWRKDYDARLVYYGGATMEFQVGRAPQTPAASKQLAWEQMVYCSDIVYQGVGDLPALAKTVHRQPHWYFWWD